MNTHKKAPRILLGSGSTSRAQQLHNFNIPFDQLSPNINESLNPLESCEQAVKRICQLKQQALIPQCQNILISADQMLEVNHRILGKPHDSSTALEQLMFCQGKKGNFHTSMDVWCKDLQQSFKHHSITTVQYRNFSTEEAKRYISLDRPEKCAGSIKIESLGMLLMASVTADDPSAIIGLPMLSLFKTINSIYPQWWLQYSFD
ncbi:MAG TPA: Maf family protein [Gammaproteobacteria bacterium]|nr:Maf family protein [Gammaproteobacteria bacterium]